MAQLARKPLVLHRLACTGNLVQGSVQQAVFSAVFRKNIILDMEQMLASRWGLHLLLYAQAPAQEAFFRFDTLVIPANAAKHKGGNVR